MIAKQTVLSASLVVWLGGATGTASADPVAAPDPSASEVETEDETAPVCGEDDHAPGCVAPDPDAPAPAPPPDPAKRAPTGTFQLGAGYDPDDGFIATARVAQSDLFRTGLGLELSAQLSQRAQLFGLTFVDPHVLGSDLLLAARIYNDRKELTGFTRQAAGGSLTLAQPLGEHVRAFIGYRLEHVAVETDDLPPLARGVGADRLPELGDGLISALRVGLTYDSRDRAFLPRHGTSAGAMLEVADPRLGSDVQLSRATGWLNHHRPLGPFTLHVGGTISGVTSRDPLGVPLSERLQLDGSGDIRGYAPGSLGPFDRRTGIALGGNFKATARAELELPVIPSLGISVAGFLDAGAIYDQHGRGGFGSSAGVGLIWNSPIGALRFDWAVPLEGGAPRFLFSLGF